MILENVTATVVIPGCPLTEPQFVSQILNASHTGWLCDITNLYINAINQKQQISEFLDAWPWDKLVQMHFSGGHQAGDHLVDSHAFPTSEPVWTLLEDAIKRSNVRGIILERDENIPPFDELAHELHRARDIGRRLGRWD